MILSLIQSLPNELLEIIFINIKKTTDTKIELVCKRWNQICLNPIIYSLRIPCLCSSYNNECNAVIHKCICLKGPYHALHCRSSTHPCICNKGPNNAYRCKSKIHQCICLKGILNIIQCKNNDCPCVCSEKPLFIKNCRGHRY